MGRLIIISFVLSLAIYSFGQTQELENNQIRFSNEITWQKEKKLLKAFSNKLKEDETMYFHIVIRRNPYKSEKFNQRMRNILNYLVKEQKIEKERIQFFIIGTCTNPKTAYFLLPKGSEPPLY